MELKELFRRLGLTGIRVAEMSRWRRVTLRRRILDAFRSENPSRRPRGNDWLPLSPGIRIKPLRVDSKSGYVSALWNVDAGAGIPPHFHHHADECVVVSGTIAVGGSILRRGDYLLGRQGEWHPRISSPGGAMLYVRAHMPAVIQAAG